MPQLSSPLSTPAGMAGVNPAHVGKMAGVRLHFPSFAAFTAAVTSGATGFASDLWADGQEMTISDEAGTGAVRIWRSSLAHARTVRAGGSTFVLAADTNLVIPTTGEPSSGAGSVGDVAIDAAAARYYTKLSSGWGAAAQLYPGAAAAKVSGAAKPFNFTLPGQNSGTGLTIVNQRPALGQFYGFRLHYLNHDSAPWTIAAAKAASISTHLNDGVTGASTPVNITFNEAGTSAVPAGSGTGSNAVPGILSSDAIYHASVARTDDPSKKPLLQIRTHSTGTQNVLQPPGTNFFQNYNADAKSGGRQWAAGNPGGDNVSTWGAYTPNVTSSSPFVHPALVEFFYERSVSTIACCDDSIGAGKGTTFSGVTLDQYGIAQSIADALMASSGKLWEVCSFATPSQGFAAICDTAKRIIPLLRPDYLLLPAWSPNNNATSDSVMLECRARLLEVAEKCQRHGVKLVVRTSGPVNAYDVAADARIKTHNAWARLMATRGAWGLVDIALLLDPTNSGQIASAYNGDGLHYNNAFYTAVGPFGAATGEFR